MNLPKSFQAREQKNSIFLDLWQEIVGKIESINLEEGYAEISNNRIYLPRDFLQILTIFMNEKIAIIKTDNISNLYRVRKF